MDGLLEPEELVAEMVDELVYLVEAEANLTTNELNSWQGISPLNPMVEED